jgi:alkylhydroperoxidase family enzyme
MATCRPRISYVDPESVADADMRAELDRAWREGTPRAESHAIRAHVPAVFWSFARTWDAVFRRGLVDHDIKELCRVYVSRSVNCRYCGSQRSLEGARLGLSEQDFDDVLDYRRSTRYNRRQKAALAFADAITWDRDADDAMWEALGEHFSEPQIVELGYFIGFTMGQQRFLRTLNLDQHPLPPPRTPDGGR